MNIKFHLRAEIERRLDFLRFLNSNTREARIEENRHILDFLDSLPEQPKLTQVPHIEQETQKKGWMNYGLLISEIGLHRSNAIDRIKETKERAAEIKRIMAPHDLAILGKYLESVGAEIVLCCLQRYCMDFMFTQDEVKEIIQQEQPEVDLEKAFEKEFAKFSNDPDAGDYALPIALSDYKDFARHFAEWQKDKMMEEAMEGFIERDCGGQLILGGIGAGVGEFMLLDSLAFPEIHAGEYYPVKIIIVK